MIKLQPLKEGTPIGKFAVLDIEARHWTDFEVSGYFDGDSYLEHFSIKEFLRGLFSFRANRIPNTVFAHFGGKYDFLFIIDAIIEESGYEIQNCIPRGSSLLSFDLWFDGRKVSFRDTSSFLPFSLDRLTKTFGVEHKKKKFDFDEYNRLDKSTAAYKKKFLELREYLQYDCKGLYEVIWRYVENPLIQRAGFSFTTASQALKIFRTYLKEPIPGIYGRADAYIRKGYFGGRTEIFKPLFDGPGNIYSYDINSLYPAVLADPNNDFPGGISGLTDKIDFDSVGFFWCEIFVPEQYMPPLPYVYQGKLLFPCGYIDGIWSVAELKNAVEHYGVKIIRVKSGYKCENIGNPFSEFILEMYNRRLEAKANKDEVTDIICKLTMNSLYGRFGLRKDRENFAFDENQEGFNGKWTIEKELRSIRLGTVPVELTSSFSNIAIAAYTTSYARIRNVNLASPWAEKHLYYTDTDCFPTTKKLAEGKGLGELKLEYTAEQACFLLPKTYIIKSQKDNFKIVLEGDDPDNPTKTNKKIVMKGFNSRKVWRTFDLNHFKTALEGDLSLMKIKNEPKFATFKRALQRNKVLAMLDSETRQIRSKYTKRVIFKDSKGNYDTRPLIIDKEGIAK